jgi:hypothetical protein
LIHLKSPLFLDRSTHRLPASSSRYGLVVDVTAPGRALIAPLLWLSKVGERKNKTRHRAATQTITGMNAQLSSSVPRGGIGLPVGR